MLANPVTTKVGGYLPDPFDRNDKRVKLIRSGLSDIAKTTDEHVIEEYTPISNQGLLSSCVANAWADALEMLLAKETGSVVQLSRLFLYWTARSFTGHQKIDSGTYLRVAAQQLMNIGIPPERFWQYDLKRVFTSPGLEAYNIASDNKIEGVYRIDSQRDDRCDDVELCIKANHPVVFGTGVGREFQEYWGDERVFGVPLHMEGRHAMIVTGVRSRQNGAREFLVRNSWGNTWGKTGHAWINEEYLEWVETQDLWVGTRMKSLVV